jgi:GNAT superfamily N-acetyltransferase
MHDLSIRRAAPEDAPTIHELIRALAAYEREPDAVRATPESLAEQMRWDRPPFECLLAERRGDRGGGGEVGGGGGDLAVGAVGFALFFTSYSTWRGRPGVWLEDLFVREEERGRGAGAALLRAVGRIAVKRGCARLEFSVLDWNEPAIGFYKSLGALPMDAWTIFRFDGDALARLGAAEPGGA